jgi:hypothetical protein
MRRDLPWGFLGLLAIAGLVGALLGVADQPPVPSARQRIAGVIAATRAAGSARFRYVTRTDSPNPLARGTSSGTGAVDFRADAASTVEEDRQTSVTRSAPGPGEPTTQTIEHREVWIGRTIYVSLDPGLPGSDGHWAETRIPADLSGSLGGLGQVGPLAQVVSVVAAPDVRIDEVGSAFVDGRPTTEYRLMVPACRAAATGDGPRTAVGPTDVWIDQRGRLVQASSVFDLTVPKTFPIPSGPGRTSTEPDPLAGRSTTTSTVRLFAFGAPVEIAAPRATDVGSAEGVALSLQAKRGCTL